MAVGAGPSGNSVSGPREDGAPEGRSDRRVSAAEGLALAAVLALALASRLYRATAQSLWYDEGTSAALATRTLRDVLLAAANDIHPPLYYLGLALWARLLGDGVASLRGYSALLGTLGVLGAWLFARRLAGPAIGLLTAFLAALAPYLIWYGQEVRMYVQAAMLAPWLAWGAVVWVEGAAGGSDRPSLHDRPRAPTRGAPTPADAARPRGAVRSGLRARRALGWAAILAGTTAAWYTHYFAGVSAVAAANLVALLAWLRRWRAEGRPAWGPALSWVGAQALALLLFAPWLRLAWPALSSWPALGDPVGAGFLAVETLRTLAFGTRAPETIARGAGLAAVLAVAALGLLAGLSGRLGARGRWAAACGALCAATPTLLIWTASLRRPAWNPKFLVAGAAGFELLLALGIAAPVALLLVARRRQAAPRAASPPGADAARGEEGRADPDDRPRRDAALLAAGAASLGLSLLVLAPRTATWRANAFDPAHQRDDYRGIAAEIDAAAGPDDAVILTAPTQVEVYDLYDRGAHAAYPLPLGRPADEADTRARLEAIGREHRDLYAILWAQAEADPEGWVEGWLREHRALAYDRWFGNVRLALWAEMREGAEEQLAAPVVFHAPAEGNGPGKGSARVRLDALTLAPGARLVPGEEVLTLEARWAAEPGARPDLVTFLHLVGPSGTLYAQRDLRPGGGVQATSTWEPGRSYEDRMALALPRDLAGGDFRLRLGLYDPATGERLRLEDGSDALELGPLRVDAPGF